MKSRLPHTPLPWVVRNIATILTIIFFVKVAGYFTVIEDRTITQIFKVIARIGMTATIFLVFRQLGRIGCLTKMRLQHTMALFLYGAYLLLGLISFCWSTDVTYSALQWLMTFESLVFAMLFVQVTVIVNRHFPAHAIDLVKVVTRSIFFVHAILLIGSFIDPDMFYREMRGGEEIRFGGYLMNPNELGMLAVIGAATAFVELQTAQRKWWAILFLLTGITVLALTSSRSSMIGFLAIMGILILRSNNRKLKVAMGVGVLLAVPAILKFVIFKEGGGVEEVMSMTGRIPFWTALLNEGIVREPFFGYGFMRINYFDTFQGDNTYPGRMTHNTFMQVLMNVGFVGFFIIFWQVVATLRNFFVQPKHRYNALFIAVFIPIIINSFTEFGVFGEANYGILFYQFLLVLFLLGEPDGQTLRDRVRWKRFRQRFPQPEAPVLGVLNE